MGDSNQDASDDKIPDDFHKLLKDFMKDLFTTFPEYKEKVGDEMMYLYDNSIDDESCKNKYDEYLKKVFKYCQGVFPERFFDILYKNEVMFDKTQKDKGNTMFYPNVDFADLWQEDISDKTKDVLWRYLQISLFTIVNVMDSGTNFGDTAKLFEAIGEEDLQKKMKETFDNLSDMLDFSGNTPFTEDFEKMAKNMGEFMDSSGNENKHFDENFMNNMPNPEELQEHIKSMLDGKIGRLAQDIAAETAADINLTDEASIEDAFEKMVKSPGKLLSLVKKIGDKIDERIKSGELKESELMQEATDMMNKMKNMPGMDNMEGLLNKMAASMGGKNAKFDMNAFNQKSKASSQKDKMMQELERRRAAKMQAELESKNVVNNVTEENLTFSTYTDNNGTPVEKTPLASKAKRKRKNKKKK